MNILLVDDDSLFRNMVSVLLVKEGHEVQTACSYDDATDMLGNNISYDLVITDIFMPPGKDGTQLMQYIRANSSEIPILAVTSGMDDVEGAVQDYVTWADLYADAAMAKPVSKERLLASIN